MIETGHKPALNYFAQQKSCRNKESERHRQNAGQRYEPTPSAGEGDARGYTRILSI
jgi:hypothetical protein